MMNSHEGKASLAAIVFQKLFGLRRGGNIRFGIWSKRPKRAKNAIMGIYTGLAKRGLSGAPYRPLFSTGCVAMPTGGPGPFPARKNPRESASLGLGQKKPVFPDPPFSGGSQTCLFEKKSFFGPFSTFSGFRPQKRPFLALFGPFRDLTSKPFKLAILAYFP